MAEGALQNHTGEIDGAEKSPPLQGEELRASLQKQLEFYFSRENLAQDGYLVSQMNADLYVPISVVASFPMVRGLTEDVELITEVLKTSPAVQVDETGELVRPSAAVRRHTIIIREIPSETPVDAVREIFAGEGIPVPTSIRGDIGDTWFVTFATEEETTVAFERVRERTFQGKVIKARIKSESIRMARTSNPSVGHAPPGAFQGHVPPQMAAPYAPMQPFEIGGAAGPMYPNPYYGSPEMFYVGHVGVGHVGAPPYGWAPAPYYYDASGVPQSHGTPYGMPQYSGKPEGGAYPPAGTGGRRSGGGGGSNGGSANSSMNGAASFNSAIGSSGNGAGPNGMMGGRGQGQQTRDGQRKGFGKEGAAPATTSAPSQQNRAVQPSGSPQQQSPSHQAQGQQAQNAQRRSPKKGGQTSGGARADGSETASIASNDAGTRQSPPGEAGAQQQGGKGRRDGQGYGGRDRYGGRAPGSSRGPRGAAQSAEPQKAPVLEEKAVAAQLAPTNFPPLGGAAARKPPTATWPIVRPTATPAEHPVDGERPNTAHSEAEPAHSGATAAAPSHAQPTTASPPPSAVASQGHPSQASPAPSTQRPSPPPAVTSDSPQPTDGGEREKEAQAGHVAKAEGEEAPAAKKASAGVSYAAILAAKAAEKQAAPPAKAGTDASAQSASVSSAPRTNGAQSGNGGAQSRGPSRSPSGQQKDTRSPPASRRR